MFGIYLADFLKIISKVLKWQYSEICTKHFLSLPCQCSQHKALKGRWYQTVAHQANNNVFEDLKVNRFRIFVFDQKENCHFSYLSLSIFKMLVLFFDDCTCRENFVPLLTTDGKQLETEKVSLFVYFFLRYE